jgi:hypothetical protein
MTRPSLCWLALVIVFSSDAAGSQVVSPPERVGTLAHPAGPKLPADVAFYGTDLGWTFVHDGVHHILFGDTWAQADAPCGGGIPNDDAQGTLPLDPPAGDQPVTFVTQPGSPSAFAPIHVYRGTESLAMSSLQVPLTGWSDGADAAAIFGRGDFIQCERKRRGAKATCRTPKPAAGEPPVGPRQGGLVCDESLGKCAVGFSGLDVPCVMGTNAGCLPGDVCVASEAGFCLDPTSSQYVDPASHGPLAVAHEQEIGIQRDAEPAAYDSVLRWRTNKFTNATARAVTHLTPSGAGDDYAPGTGALLIWGRPLFTAEGERQARLYLAQMPLPLRDAKGRTKFAIRYFAGVDEKNRPRWSKNEKKAVPLAMDGAIGGDPHEILPIPGQMAMTWLPAPIAKWVMLYGGDTPFYFLGNPPAARPGPEPGSIRIRFADKPWGPWTPAVPHLTAGSETTTGDSRGPGGVLYHPGCTDDGEALCTPTDPTRPLHLLNEGCAPFAVEIDYGFFYGPNFIDAWTRSDGAGGFDLYWNVSTWNPYGVQLYRTNVQPAP